MEAAVVTEELFKMLMYPYTRVLDQMIDFSASTEKLRCPFQVVAAAVRADLQRQKPRWMRIDGARKKFRREENGPSFFANIS